MRTNSRFQRVAGQLAQICAAVTCVMGLLMALAWVSGHGAFKFPLVEAPMAPTTAGLMMLAGIGLLLQSRSPGRASFRWFFHGLLLLICVLTVAVLFAHARDVDLGFEAQLAPHATMVAGFRSGRTAVPTVLLFLIGALGLWMDASDIKRGPRAKRLAAACGFLVMLSGAAFTLMSLAGVMELYPPGRLRIAPVTSTLFAVWGMGLLAAALADESVLRWMSGQTQAEQGFRLSGFDRALLGSSALLLAGLCVGGVFYLREQIAAARSEAQRNLQALADSKLDQVMSWRDERLSDARFFNRAEFVRRDVAECLEHPESTQARANTLQWMKLLKAGTRYRWVALFDSGGSLRLSLPPEGEKVDSETRKLVAEALTSTGPRMHDLARSNTDNVHLDVLFPIIAPAQQAAGASNHVIAAVLLRLLPDQVLYPLLSKWPTPSDTAETVLVRREGNEVVILNPLRRQTNRPLELRVSLAETNSPLVKAALGEFGSVEGMDYLGTTVLAELRTVPNSPWHLVVKMDTDEIYAVARQQAWIVLEAVGILVLLLLAVTGLVWQQRNTELLQKQLVARRERALSERLTHLMNMVNDVILLSDSQGHIIEASPRASQWYGRTIEELQGLRLQDLQAPESQFDATLERATEMVGSSTEFQALHRRKDGSQFQVEFSSRRVEIGGERYWLNVVRDITRRTHAEAERARLLAILERTPDFVGAADLRGQVVYLNAAACRLAGLAPAANITHLSITDFHAARSAELVSQEGLSVARRDGVWIGETTLRSSTGHELPMSQVIIAHKDARGEVTHFSTIMRDLSERKRIEQAIRGSEERLRTIVEHSTQLHYSHAPDRKILYLSPQAREFLDCEPEEAPTKTSEFLSDHPINAAGVAVTDAAIRTGQRQPPFELELRTRKGRKLWVEARESPVVLKGSTVAIVGSLTDITQRKRSEQIIQRLAQLSRDLGAVTEANQAGMALANAAQELLGWDACFLEIRTPDLKGAHYVLSFDTIDGRRVPVPPAAGTEITPIEHRVMTEGAVMVLREPGTTEMFVPFGNMNRPSLSLLYVPLRHQGRYLGMFSVQSYSPRAYDSAALELLQTLADHVAGALERIRAEQALHESERFLSKAQEVAGVGCYSLHIASGVWTGTPMLDRLFGIAADFPRTVESWLQLVHSEDRTEMGRYFQEDVLRARKRFDKEYRIIRASDGEVRWMFGLGELECDTVGQPVRMIGTVQDITERKLAEQTLRESEERFRRAVSLSPFPIMLHAEDGTVLEISRAWTELSGYAPEEIRTTADWTSRAYRDRAPSVLAWNRRLYETEGRVAEGEYAIHTKGGEERIWDFSSARVGTLRDGRRLVVSIASDVTERKRAEAALRELSGRILAAQDEERRRIARELHDTTAQTIAALCVNLTMVEARIPASEGEAHCLLADAAALGERAGQEIRTVAYLLHPPILEHVGLAGAIREYAAGFTRRSGVQVSVEINASVGRLAPEVELALLRIVQESLGNVHRHSGSPTAVIRLQTIEHQVLLDVADAGKGLRPELLAGGGEGHWGVGLAGMRERLRHLGGHLELKSSSAGTVVRAVLPLPQQTQPGKN